jgi:uncharacterized membrane protein
LCLVWSSWSVAQISEGDRIKANIETFRKKALEYRTVFAAKPIFQYVVGLGGGGGGGGGVGGGGVVVIKLVAHGARK